MRTELLCPMAFGLTVLTSTVSGSSSARRTSGVAMDGSLVQAITAALYRPEQGRDSTIYLSNAAQRIQGAFRRSGVAIGPCDTGKTAWSLGLRPLAIGRGGSRSTLPGATPIIRGDRVVYARRSVDEWYANSPKGIEQGFTLNARPSGPAFAPISVALEARGGFHARNEAHAGALRLSDGRGHALIYRDVRAWDARHRALPARLTARGYRITLSVDDRRAAYPITIDPLILAETDLVASDGQPGDGLGAAIAVDGSRILVGAPGQAGGTGAVYVFNRNFESWSLEAELTAQEAGPGDQFGASLSSYGGTTVVGAAGTNNGAGAAYIFTVSGSVWTEQTQVSASDAAAKDHFGYVVSADVGAVLVGAPGKSSGKGAAYLFTGTANVWSQQKKLTAAGGVAGDMFGCAVSLATGANTLVVGAEGAANNKGSAYIFNGSGNTWSQKQTLTAGDAAAGDHFGHSLALGRITLGQDLLVGAPGKATNTGAAYLFALTGATWQQSQKFTATGGAPGDSFGSSVANGFWTLAIGAPGVSSATGAGYILQFTNAGWVQQAQVNAAGGAAGDKLGASVAADTDTVAFGLPGRDMGQGAGLAVRIGPEVNDPGANAQSPPNFPGARFGLSVALHGDYAVVGSPFHGDPNFAPGAVLVFQRQFGAWVPVQTLTAKDGAHGDAFGASVGIFGGLIVVGAPFRDNNAGAIDVFTQQQDGLWAQEARVTPGDVQAGDEFGTSVAVVGNDIVAGAPDQNMFIGAAYVYTHTGKKTTLQAKLLASDGKYYPVFGQSVALISNTIVVGAPNAGLGGQVYVFTKSGNNWVQLPPLTASDGNGSDFGQSVAVSAVAIAVGSPGTATQTGAVYMYTKSAGKWLPQQILTPEDAALEGHFGQSVSLSGYILAAGDPASGRAGTAYAFDRDFDGQWRQKQEMRASDGEVQDQFGASVAISFDTIAIGATGKTSLTGAAYLYGDHYQFMKK